MKITTRYLNEVLAETVKDFNNKVFPLNNKVELNIVDKDKFLESVKNDPLIQLQVKKGLYKDIEKEYPNFVVVYLNNKNPLLSLFGIPYRISICFEMAKDKLKPFTKAESTNYLKRIFAHEIGHLVQDDYIKQNPDEWQKCLEETFGDEKLAKEKLVENLADLLIDEKSYEVVYNHIWGLVLNRTKKISKGMK